MDGVTTAGDDQVSAFGSLARSAGASVRDDVLGGLHPDRPDGPGGLLPRRSSPACCARRLGFDGVVDLRRPRQRQGRERRTAGRAGGPVPGRGRHAGAHRRPLDRADDDRRRPRPQRRADPAFAARSTRRVHTALLAKARAGLLWPADPPRRRRPRTERRRPAWSRGCAQYQPVDCEWPSRRRASRSACRCRSGRRRSAGSRRRSSAMPVLGPGGVEELRDAVGGAAGVLRVGVPAALLAPEALEAGELAAAASLLSA